MGLHRIGRAGQDGQAGMVRGHFHHLGQQQGRRRRADHLGGKCFRVGQQPFVARPHPGQAAGIDLHLVGAALRHLGLDECNEQAHQRLMRCYARLGQPQLAERQYRACVTVLRSQLGLSPSDETTALYRRIAARCVD